MIMYSFTKKGHNIPEKLVDVEETLNKWCLETNHPGACPDAVGVDPTGPMALNSIISSIIVGSRTLKKEFNGTCEINEFDDSMEKFIEMTIELAGMPELAENDKRDTRKLIEYTLSLYTFRSFPGGGSKNFD